MSTRGSTVIDFVTVVATPRSQTVEKRIERRLEVLREWLSAGVPAGKTIPRSLNETRLWYDNELGIDPIKSPNEFTTTHPNHGRLVRDIAGLLTALLERYKRPKRSKPRPTEVAMFDRRAFDNALTAAVSQWHSERDERLNEKKRADSAQLRSVILLDENADKDRLIADLRRQLLSQRGLRAVE